MLHFRGNLLCFVAADITKLINKDKCTKTTDLYKRWHNKIEMIFFYGIRDYHLMMQI